MPEQGSAAAHGICSARDDRFTHFLLLSCTAAMRADPCFERRVAGIGLQLYWRRAGAEPDYRIRQR